MNLKFCTLGLLSISWVAALAQTTTPAKVTDSKKTMAFDIVSIRENRSPPAQQQGGPSPFGPTADGYRMTGMPFLVAIVTAFVPQNGGGMFMPDQIKGLPDWAMSGRYDIQAKVSDSDMTEWQKPEAQATMLPAMLQNMLEERCKLVAHREMKESGVQLLVLAKDGPKFKETNPTDPPPAGMTLPGGATMAISGNSPELRGTTMGFFATMLSEAAGGRIEDRTGLTGKYSIPLTSVFASRSEASGISLSSALAELGLKLTSSKAQVETLVIDHMEKPSEN